MTNPELICFRCQQPGHIAADCPELRPATSKAEHEGRIAAYIQPYWDGHLTEWQKRKAIAEENKMWYGEKCRPELRNA